MNIDSPAVTNLYFIVPIRDEGETVNACHDYVSK
jgi:hypothetical protein